ncbi:MAG: hypothetical protein IPO62_16590 [Saprospiraceae bacterium]|nr:hypothetical protein [Saprospiraceae bacterium]
MAVDGMQNRIIRTWTAEDSYSESLCLCQNIEEKAGDLFSVTVPPNFDNLDQLFLTLVLMRKSTEAKISFRICLTILNAWMDIY